MDEQALLHAICENPDDDAPRLVYADWLEEHGRAERAEFIRVQIEVSPNTAPRERQKALRERERELTKSNDAAWRAHLPKLPLMWGEFERGFVASITGGGLSLLEHGPQIFAAAPIRKFTVLSLPRCDRLFDDPLVSRLTKLEISAEFEDARRLAVGIAGSKHLAGLRSLSLGPVEIGDDGVEEISSSPYLHSLTELVLSFCQVGPIGARSLARAPNMKTLRRLVLSHNRIDSTGAQDLLSSRYLTNLESLYLNGNPIDPATRSRLRRRFGRGVCIF